MSRKFLFLAVFSILGLSAFSQMSADRIYFGVKGGMGLSWAKYSELKNRDPKMLFGGVGGVLLNLSSVRTVCFLSVQKWTGFREGLKSATVIWIIN